MKKLILMTLLAMVAPACNDATKRSLPAGSAVAAGQALKPGPRCPLPGQVAVAEICNGFDDDCDGVIDENVCSDPCDTPWTR
jgi:hypothetical protein